MSIQRNDIWKWWYYTNGLACSDYSALIVGYVAISWRTKAWEYKLFGDYRG